MPIQCVCGNLTIFYSGFVCVAFIYNVILFTILFTLLLFKNRALMPIQCVFGNLTIYYFVYFVFI